MMFSTLSEEKTEKPTINNESSSDRLRIVANPEPLAKDFLVDKAMIEKHENVNSNKLAKKAEIAKEFVSKGFILKNITARIPAETSRIETKLKFNIRLLQTNKLCFRHIF